MNVLQTGMPSCCFFTHNTKGHTVAEDATWIYEGILDSNSSFIVVPREFSNSALFIVYGIFCGMDEHELILISVESL